MELDELRHRIGIILVAEERATPDWAEVERLTDELQQQLRTDTGSCPEVVNHFLDDADIRARDEVYAASQRRLVREFVETGKYPISTPVPLWTCAVVIALGGSLLLWFLA